VPGSRHAAHNHRLMHRILELCLDLSIKDHAANSTRVLRQGVLHSLKTICADWARDVRGANRPHRVLQRAILLLLHSLFCVCIPSVFINKRAAVPASRLTPSRTICVGVSSLFRNQEACQVMIL
jgi:hypothetical protein